jgi:hypothetical protein|eukprot:COSAG01_NODE_2984_length_6753_cov_235.182447_7_plen_49_part_00
MLEWKASTVDSTRISYGSSYLWSGESQVDLRLGTYGSEAAHELPTVSR